MSTLAALNPSTIRLLGGTQVITSVFSVVKELIENALDAGASTIDIRLENYGLDKVEVRDNGIGIPNQNVPFVAKRYHTSKIESFSDIQHLETYGFRGEALGSLCTVSTLSITTKTREDEVSLSYAFNNQGQIISSHPSHLTQGTTVTAIGLFKNIPVRRQFYNTNKKKKEEIKKIEDLLIAFSIILPKLRFTLNHDKERIFQKNGCPDVRTAMLSILGRNVLNCLVQKTVQLEDLKITIDLFLPNPASDVLTTSKSDNSRCICAINRRPVQMKDMEKLIRQHYVSHKKTDGHRHPIYFLSVTLATDQIDVNVDPNKTIVLLHQKAEITKGLISVLEELYGSISKSNDDTVTNHDNSYTDSNKGDMSSDFDDSLVVIPVTSNQPNIPVVKISTNNKNIVLTKHYQPETISEKLEEGIENIVSNKIYNDDLEKEENISLTQLGKPVFQVVEESLDDWINEKNDNISSTVSKQIEKDVADIEKTPNNIIQNIEKGQDPCTSDKNIDNLSVNQITCNIHFESNPKLCDIYSDIVSTWKDSPLEDGPEIPVQLPEVQSESTCLSENQNCSEKGQNKGMEVDANTDEINQENVCQTKRNETASGNADMCSKEKSLTNDTKSALARADMWSSGKSLTNGTTLGSADMWNSGKSLTNETSGSADMWSNGKSLTNGTTSGSADMWNSGKSLTNETSGSADMWSNGKSLTNGTTSGSADMWSNGKSLTNETSGSAEMWSNGKSLTNETTSASADMWSSGKSLTNETSGSADMWSNGKSLTNGTTSASTDMWSSGKSLTNETSASADMWSRGKSLTNETSSSADMWSNGKSLTNDTTDIQPVTILQGKRLMSLSVCDEGPPLKKRLVIPQDEGQRRLSDIVSSQPVKHPQTAFILYCKDNRSRVIAENPLADYDKVTRILDNKWEDLPDEDKDKYFQKTSPVKTKIKRTSIGSEKKERNFCSKMKQQNKSSKSWTTIKDQLMKQKLSSALQKTKNVSFSLPDLKTVFSQKMFASQSQNSSHINLIGPLKTCGVWIGCHSNCLKIINPHRIQETVLYHNLMANHIVQSEKLEPPMQLTKSHLGETLWTTLTSLADQMCSSGIYNVIQDKRLTANGIGVTFHIELGEFTAKITELCRCIPVYGLADVKEVLQLISTTKAITVAETRPLKVLNYLQGEAVRMARQLPRQQSRDDMVDILIQKETMLPLKCENCLHNKPFYHTVYSLDDIPLTQSQAQ
ncbi:PMS1 protein homolog 1-like isoform X2 [Mytilus galloprovincialis]|uniref:PMS1 protein homolog 1-like isoform X2 n=1 Tax=Mytilus galloprovincialis TaxID=29158 RepID=UPI003F7BE3DB